MFLLFVHVFHSVNCPPGTSGATNGTSPACFPCPMGTYQPGEGKTSCLPCPAGFNSRRTGLEDLTSCKGKLLYSDMQCFTGQWLRIKTNSTYRPECRDTSGTFACGPHENSKSFRMAAGQTIEKMN